MSGELMVHSHDALVRLSSDDIDRITDGVKMVVELATSVGDPEGIFQLIDKMSAAQQVSWVATAHALFEAEKQWGTTFPSDVDFKTVAAARLNKSRITIRRYLRIWEWVIDRPKHTKKRLKILFTKPFPALDQLVGVCRSEDMKEEHWEIAEKAVNVADFRDLRRKIRDDVVSGKKPLLIMLEDDGTIRARKGGGHYRVVGTLNMHDDDEVIRAAVDRIEKNSGMFRRS